MGGGFITGIILGCVVSSVILAAASLSLPLPPRGEERQIQTQDSGAEAPPVPVTAQAANAPDAPESEDTAGLNEAADAQSQDQPTGPSQAEEGGSDTLVDNADAAAVPPPDTASSATTTQDFTLTIGGEPVPQVTASLNDTPPAGGDSPTNGPMVTVVIMNVVDPTTCSDGRELPAVPTPQGEGNNNPVPPSITATCDVLDDIVIVVDAMGAAVNGAVIAQALEHAARAIPTALSTARATGVRDDASLLPPQNDEGSTRP